MRPRWRVGLQGGLQSVASQEDESKRPRLLTRGLMERPTLSFDGVDDRLDTDGNPLSSINKTVFAVISSRRDGGSVWGASSAERGEGLRVDGQEVFTEYDGVETSQDAPSLSGSPWIVTNSVGVSNGDRFLQARWDFEDINEPGLDYLGQSTGQLNNGAQIVEDDERGLVLLLPNQNSSMTVPSIDIDNTWTLSAWFKGLKPQGQWRTLFRGSNDHQIIVDAGLPA